MTYTTEQIERAVDSMPYAKKAFMFSVDNFNKYMAIYKKYEIVREVMIEINNTISYFMMGLQEEATIIEKIKELIPDTTKATSLYQELQKEIVEPFKQIKNTPAPQEENDSESNNSEKVEGSNEVEGGVEVIEEKTRENELLLEAPEKDEILAGIENPISTPNYSPKINVNSITTNKLNSLVSAKPQTEKIDLTSTQTKKEPIKYSKDPYREPIE